MREFNWTAGLKQNNSMGSRKTNALFWLVMETCVYISLRKQPKIRDAATGLLAARNEMSFRGEISGGFSKCRLFPQADRPL